MGLHQIDHPDDGRRRLAIERAVRWLRGMQGKDGGWASFDTDQTRLLFNNIPFADHGALLDPATEDLTARCIECFARLGRRRATIRRSSGASRSSAGPRRPRARGTGAGASTTSTGRGRSSGRSRRSGSAPTIPMVGTRHPVARGSPEPGRGLGRDLRLLRRRRPQGPRRVRAQPDGLGPPRPDGRGPGGHPGGGARHRVPPPEPARRTAAGTTRSGTERASPGSSTCSTTSTPTTFPLWALGAWRRLTR